MEKTNIAQIFMNEYNNLNKFSIDLRKKMIGFYNDNEVIINKWKMIDTRTLNTKNKDDGKK
jgi:hypothetical protein